MLNEINTRDSLIHAKNCVDTMFSSYGFFMENKLWQGFFKHKWIALTTILISLLFSYWILCDIASFFTNPSVDIPTNEAGIISAQMSEESQKAHVQSAFSGGSKYLLLILLEIVIFYFSVKAVEILTGKSQTVKMTNFWKAEIRMIKVLIRGFIQALVIQIAISIVFGVFGISSSIKQFLMFFVYAYFLGHAFFDNYNEINNLTIKHSEKITRNHFGATLILGTVASVFLLIPVIGAIITPIFAALTANIYGHNYRLKDISLPTNLKK